jgi:hypothetical protein
VGVGRQLRLATTNSSRARVAATAATTVPEGSASVPSEDSASVRSDGSSDAMRSTSAGDGYPNVSITLENSVPLVRCMMRTGALPAGGRSRSRRERQRRFREGRDDTVAMELVLYQNGDGLQPSATNRSSGCSATKARRTCQCVGESS